MDHGEMLKDIEIFRAGNHTASDGSSRTWTEQDLDQLVNNYDPAYMESPVVIGHPTTNGPAYGWVKGLKRSGKTLLADLDVLPEFKEAVQQGLYKKRSSSIYANLDGKGLYLRHVGFLGAMPPAVKALQDINLNDSDESVTIEFTEATKKMNFKEWFKSFKSTVAEMPDEIPEGVNLPVQFSEEEVAAREAAAREAERAAISAEFAEKERQAEATRAVEAHKAAVRSKVDALIKDGKVIPAWEKAGLVSFMERLGTNDVADFAEGNAQTAYDWFVSFLEALPKTVNFEEVATKETDPGKENTVAQFEHLVNTKTAEGMSYSEAFSAAQRENPDLAKEYLETIRQ